MGGVGPVVINLRRARGRCLPVTNYRHVQPVPLPPPPPPPPPPLHPLLLTISSCVGEANLAAVVCVVPFLCCGLLHPAARNVPRLPPIFLGKSTNRETNQVWLNHTHTHKCICTQARKQAHESVHTRGRTCTLPLLSLARAHIRTHWRGTHSRTRTHTSPSSSYVSVPHSSMGLRTPLCGVHRAVKGSLE